MWLIGAGFRKILHESFLNGNLADVGFFDQSRVFSSCGEPGCAVGGIDIGFDNQEPGIGAGFLGGQIRFGVGKKQFGTVGKR